jgi:hypothetical protein
VTLFHGGADETAAAEEEVEEVHPFQAETRRQGLTLVHFSA